MENDFLGTYPVKVGDGIFFMEVYEGPKEYIGFKAVGVEEAETYPGPLFLRKAGEIFVEHNPYRL